MDASVAQPNQATSPGPCEIGAKAVVPPASLATTYSGAPGPSAVAIGTTTRCSFAGLSPIRSLPSSSSASAGLAAQPSATTAACMDLRSGSGACG